MGKETISNLQVEEDVKKALTGSGVLETDVDEVIALRELLSEIPLGKNIDHRQMTSVDSLANAYSACEKDMIAFREIATKAMEMAPKLGLTTDRIEAEKSGGIFTIALDRATASYLASR